MRFGVVAGVIMAATVALPAAASAASYPPATYGEGQVDRSVVHPGECVHFSGGGYAKNAHLSVTDNGAPTARGKADRAGNFRIQVCFGTDAALGPHRLQATGQGANGAPRYVSATVTVVGVSETVGGSSSGGTVAGSAGGGNGSGLGSGSGAGSPAQGSNGAATTPGSGSGAGSTGGTTSGGNVAGAHHGSSSVPWSLIAAIAAAVLLLAAAWRLLPLARRHRAREV